MRRWIVLLCCFVVYSSVFAQEDSKQLIDEGIELHENELYVEAIRKYEQALKLDPRNLAAKYELAYSWFELGNYTKSEEYSKQVVDAYSSFYVETIILYGSSLDKQGKHKKAMRVYQSALRKDPVNNLLRYNMALSYYEVGNFDKAEEQVMAAIDINIAHASSHLLLGQIELAKGNKVKALLSMYFFLLIEQDSERSLQAYNMVTAIWRGYQVTSSEYSLISKTNTEDVFSQIEESIYKFSFPENDFELVRNCTINFLSLFKKIEENNCVFWIRHYVKFNNELIDRGFGEAYVYFASNCKYKVEVLNWIGKHHLLFNDFVDWMKEQ